MGQDQVSGGVSVLCWHAAPVAYVLWKHANNLLSRMLTKISCMLTKYLACWICSCQSVGTVNYALPFTTNVTISISILQTFRSWVATSHLRPPMAFLSHNSSDTPGLAPLMNVLFWGRCDFPISFSGRDMWRNVWNRLRKFYGRYGDLTKQYEVPLSRMLHDILDDDHIQWHPPLIGHNTNFRP